MFPIEPSGQDDKKPGGRRLFPALANQYGEVLFYQLPAYSVPPELMGEVAKGGPSSVDKPNAGTGQERVPEDALQLALTLLDGIETVQNEAMRYLRAKINTSPSDRDGVSPEEVSRLLAEEALFRITSAAISYFAERANSSDEYVCRQLVDLATLATAGYENIENAAMKTAVARVSAMLPVLVEANDLPTLEKLRSLSIGADVTPRIWVNHRGAPFSPEIPINRLAASLISYIQQVLRYRPSLPEEENRNDIIDLPAEFIRKIWTLPDLSDGARQWCDVAEGILLNSNVNLSDIPGVKTLGVHRERHATSGRMGDHPIGLKGNVEDGIRRALRQAFETFAKRHPD